MYHHQKYMNMILVTGATGHLGKIVIQNLLKKVPASQIAALVRDESKAADLQEKGVDIRIGTYEDTASLDKAMQGIDKVLLISGVDMKRLEQHKNVVDAAKKANVQFLAYTGVSMKNPESAANELMKSHFQTEDYIKESGLTYAFLRNTLYTEGVPMFAGDKVFETGIYLPAGSGKVPYALRSEMGEAAANVLLEKSSDSKTYNITGSESYSFADIAAILTDLSGQEVTYTPAEKAAFEAQMKEVGVPEFLIQITTAFSTDIKNGLHEEASSDLENLLGRKPTSLKEGLKAIYNL